MIQDQILTYVLESLQAETNLWDGQYKIPWDEPGFSARMLREHLTQEHDMASRKQECIRQQVDWIGAEYGGAVPCTLLDIGCGPGLYIQQFIEKGWNCTGIDFSPASIQYAKSVCGDRAQFLHADVRDAAFGNGYDLAMMLYGEINVFSPEEMRAILGKLFHALKPGGHVLLEMQTAESVRSIGTLPPTWYAAPQGLFSDMPHVCLTHNRWVESAGAAQQHFFIQLSGSMNADIYTSTTKSWEAGQMEAELQAVGFADIQFRSDWNAHNTVMELVAARKP